MVKQEVWTLLVCIDSMKFQPMKSPNVVLLFGDMYIYNMFLLTYKTDTI